MKKMIIPVLVTVLLSLSLGSLSASAAMFNLETELKSDAGILVNVDTGTVIVEKNPDKQLQPAHLVHIMTAIVVLENCPDITAEVLTMDENIFAVTNYDYPGDLRNSGIKDGDKLTVKDLLHAMILQSAHEAANMLAYRFGDGSIENFVSKMNAKAKEIGVNNTTFTNPNGLYSVNQLST
ncbi:MAG: serine hydrolase, partial [Oscillospiraceae bacterium]|nr:serine hydrolase [Oscillospiraceae bacterium]